MTRDLTREQLGDLGRPIGPPPVPGLDLSGIFALLPAPNIPAVTPPPALGIWVTTASGSTPAGTGPVPPPPLFEDGMRACPIDVTSIMSHPEVVP